MVLIPATMLARFFGGRLGINETKYQPMKIAAAEGQWTYLPAMLVLAAFQIGGGNNDQTPTKIIQIPHLLSVLATGAPGTARWSASTSSSPSTSSRYGAGNYVLNVFIQYWSMRVMAYSVLVLLVALLGAWLLWRKKLATARWYLPIAIWVAVLPFLMNTAGWLLTENGPPALDRAGPGSWSGRRHAVEHRHHDPHQPQRVRRALRGPGRRRLPVDARHFARKELFHRRRDGRGDTRPPLHLLR